MHRLYVSYINQDARGQAKKKQFGALGLTGKVGAVYLADCYAIDTKLNKNQLQKAQELLANPLLQSVSTQPSTLNPHPFSYAIEIGFLPGVTDNVGNTAKETLQDGTQIKFKPGQNVYSSQVVFISGKLLDSDAKKIADSLYNPLIQKAAITDFKTFKKLGLRINAPKVKLVGNNKVTKVNLDVSDEELIKLGKLGIPDVPHSSRRHSDPERVQPSEGEESQIKNKKILHPSDVLGVQSLPRAERGDDAKKNKPVDPSTLAMTNRRGPLALSLAELKVIAEYFKKVTAPRTGSGATGTGGRQPTDIELETLAQTWSEHCKHTIFADPMDELKNGLYKTYIKAATEKIRAKKGKNDFCVSVFTDNAGGIIFNKDYIICHKVETHNTPSALDPFGGAITGIVGVNRDALGFGLGSKPIANFYGFCIADPQDQTKLFRDSNLRQPMLSARRIMDGVIAGINSGGNQSGIPTPLGFLHFNSRFRGKPLVFAGTLGLIPKKINGKNSWEKKARGNDLVVMIGGRVGADGIHGATFSSEGLDSHSPATAVQIGDPITQKKFSDAVVKEARGQGLYNSITDCGAGGLSSAVGEMAKETNGCEILLDKVPLKYPGLSPWQIWISESQERMVLSVPPKKWKKFEQLMKKRGVEAAVIGKFTNSGKCVVKYGGKTVMNVEMEFLHNGRPKQHLVTQPPSTPGVILNLSVAEGEGSLNLSKRDSSDALRMTPKISDTDLKSSLLNLLSSLNITSTEFVAAQYDHEVQSSSVLKPLQGAGRVNSEAAVISPVLTSKKGAVLSYGLCPELSEIDPYQMAACSIDSAIRAAVAAGANVDYLALLDNFCWCSPEDPKRLWQLKEAARGAYDYAVSYGTPFISGKDSMHNDFKGYGDDGKPLKISIPPTLLITTVGVISDVTKAVSLDAKLPGDLLYILGNTNNESPVVAPFMGLDEPDKLVPVIEPGSGNYTEKKVPKVNAAKNLKLYQTVFKANQKNLLASAISINRGGLAIALCKKLIGGGLGGEIDLANIPGDAQENYQKLFSESQGRILVTVAPQNKKAFEKLFGKLDFAFLGKITEQPNIIIKDKQNKKILDLNINEAAKSYKAPFKDY